VLALAEDRIDVLEGGLHGRVEERAIGADAAVHRPALGVVRGLRPMRSGVLVPVGGGDDRVVVVVVTLHVLADPSCGLAPTGDGQ
jgi:hypothetical protein